MEAPRILRVYDYTSFMFGRWMKDWNQAFQALYYVEVPTGWARPEHLGPWPSVFLPGRHPTLHCRRLVKEAEGLGGDRSQCGASWFLGI